MGEKERPIVALKEKSDQTFRAIAMLNRLSVAEIRFKRSNGSPDMYVAAVKEIRDSISYLTDSLILGEDVQLDPANVDLRITELEQRTELR